MLRSLQVGTLSIVVILLINSLSDPRVALASGNSYSVSGNTILQNGQPGTWRGVDNTDCFGTTAQAYTTSGTPWSVQIVREAVPEMATNPITGNPVQSPYTGSWLYSLQSIADSNRQYGAITIFCPFAWDGKPDTQCTGANPSQQSWYPQFLTKMQAIAAQFANQPDVWIELWNEPYSWDNGNGYSDALYLSDMSQIADTIRGAGNNNIIIVPCSGEGGNTESILNEGANLLNGRSNLAFDLHCYSNWITGSQSSVAGQLNQVINANFALIIAEYGAGEPDGTTANVAPFLTTVNSLNLTALAWLWEADPTDPNSLLNAQGNAPNSGSYNYGGLVQAFINHNPPFGTTSPPPPQTPAPAPTPTPAPTPAPTPTPRHPYDKIRLGHEHIHIKPSHTHVKTTRNYSHPGRSDH